MVLSEREWREMTGTGHAFTRKSPGLAARIRYSDGRLGRLRPPRPGPDLPSRAAAAGIVTVPAARLRGAGRAGRRPGQFLAGAALACIPFGGGDRRCLGADLARFTMRTVITRARLRPARSQPGQAWLASTALIPGRLGTVIRDP